MQTMLVLLQSYCRIAGEHLQIESTRMVELVGVACFHFLPMCDHLVQTIALLLAGTTYCLCSLKMNVK